MVPTCLLWICCLAVAPPEATDPAGADARQAGAEASALADYNARREATPNTAEAQWKLALWCERNGLKPEALVHLGAVIKLDPKRSAAWEKLGFAKRNGRWVTPEQVADEAEQKKADVAWIAKLRKLHGSIHGGPKQAAAEAAMAAIDDPRAAPAIYYVFGRRGPIDQLIAVQLLGQVGDPKASKGLAVLAVYGASAEVRARATQTLRQREPDQYLGLLMGLLTDPLKYQVQPVGGPGSPGVLLVEGERYNVQRFYAPPPPPTLNYQPGDILSYDEFGLPQIVRPVERLSGATVGGPKPGSPVSLEFDGAVRFSLGEGLLQAQNAALVAQSQLRGDVKSIEQFNTMRRAFNEHVLDVARAALGEDFGKDLATWRRQAAERLGFTQADPKADRPRPTLDMLVPLAYQPIFGQPTIIQRFVIKPPDN